MSATKTIPSIKIREDANVLATKLGLNEALKSALQLIPDYFSGTSEIVVDTFADPEEQAHPHFSFELETSLERDAFRAALAEYSTHLFDTQNPVYPILAVVKNYTNA